MSRVSQARARVNISCSSITCWSCSAFCRFPLISIRFVDQMGWAALMVGIALGLRQFVQQGLGVFGGAIADRFGAKPMIVTGMLLRAAGFATMAIAHEPGCCGSPVSFPGLAAPFSTHRVPRWWLSLSVRNIGGASSRF